MNIDLAFLIMTALAIVINYITLFTLFPRRFNNIITVCVPILFSVALHIILYQTGLQTTFYRFWGGFAHIPLYILLSKGDIFQRLVVLTFTMVCIGFQLAMASAVSAIFLVPESDGFWLLMVILFAVMYTIYTLFIFKYSRNVFGKLLSNGNRREWVLYIIGAVFTYTSISIIIAVTSGGFRIILLSFAFWSFFILCFAIINTNEKAKQRFDTEMAHEIISSGREHYQKMSELQQTLQIQRHDYKYHLITVNQMLLSGDRDNAADYLSNLEKQFSKSELPRFCTNTVINALLVGYAERCKKLNIRLQISITLPDPLTVPDYDICIILGNLLENAMNVCTKLNNGRIIDLSLGFQGRQLCIVADNPFGHNLAYGDRQQVVEESNDELIINSIRAVTIRYSGEFETTWNEKSFTAYVLLTF